MFGKKHLEGHALQRMNVLSSMVSSILIRGRSELRQMALGNGERKQFASKIRQYKRLLMNERLDYKEYYLPYIEPILECLSKEGKLIFSIDGSVVGKGCMCLMFSVIYQGKAIPVVWRVYKAKKGHLPEQAHRDVLVGVVPDKCRIIIVGDGEFDGIDWQSDILKLGWDYVLKTGKGRQVNTSTGDTFKIGSVKTVKGSECYFEGLEFTAKKWMTNLLIWHGKEHCELVYLLTNLDFAPEIKRFYKKQYKIEPFFRDQKSKGFHIQKSGLSDPKRLQRLLIATCLAYVISIMAASKACKSKFYNEIARTDKRFLSLFQIGLKFIRFLVDMRQWRAFSWKRDFMPDKVYYKKSLFDKLICVPF